MTSSLWMIRVWREIVHEKESFLDDDAFICRIDGWDVEDLLPQSRDETPQARPMEKIVQTTAHARRAIKQSLQTKGLEVPEATSASRRLDFEADGNDVELSKSHETDELPAEMENSSDSGLPTTDQEMPRAVTPDYGFGGHGSDAGSDVAERPEASQAWRKYAKLKPFPPGIELSMKWAEWIDFRRKLDITVKTFVGASQKDLAGFLFTNIGSELEDIIITRGLYPKPTVADKYFRYYDVLVDNIGEYFRKASDPAANMTRFYSMKQGPGETVHDFHTKLLKQAEVCGLRANYDAIRNRLIDGMTNRLLADRVYEDGKSVDEIVAVASRKEVERAKSVVPQTFGRFDEQTKEVEVAALTTNRSSEGWGQQKRNDYRGGARKAQTFPKRRGFPDNAKQCGKCGNAYHKGGVCRAESKHDSCGVKLGIHWFFLDGNCRRCGKPGHFEKVCRSAPAGVAAVMTERAETSEPTDEKVDLYF